MNETLKKSKVLGLHQKWSSQDTHLWFSFWARHSICASIWLFPHPDAPSYTRTRLQLCVKNSFLVRMK